MYRDVELGLLLRLNPKVVAETIDRAYRSEGTEAGAAAKLGIGATTLKRWVRRLSAMGYEIASKRRRVKREDKPGGSRKTKGGRRKAPRRRLRRSPGATEARS